MSYAYRFALPIPATSIVLMIGAILSVLSVFAAASPCLPDPMGC